MKLVDRGDFQGLSRARLKEARALLRLGLSDGAYYLAGYAVECALKACIAKGTRRFEFPDKKKVDSSHSHNLRELVKIAGLEDARIEQVAAAGATRLWLTVSGRGLDEQAKYLRILGEQIMRRFA